MMNSHSPTVIFLASIQLERQSDVPLYKQIYDALREAILRGQLSSGTQIPASRELAAMLNISRNTVLNAIDQLVAEGYLETHVGSGTYVASNLPEDLLNAISLPDSQRTLSSNRELGRTGKAYQEFASQQGSIQAIVRNPYRMFNLDSVDMDAFPIRVWSKLVEKYTRRFPRHLQGNVLSGYQPLKEAIAQYVTTARGVHCTPDQIVVVSGSQQAMYMSAQLILDSGTPYWMENPGYNGGRYGLMASGGRCVPVPVDENGLDVDAAIAIEPDARLAYVTPARQFPLGYTMSLERRIKLLNWAEQQGAWIIEDDYDSEYRYDTYPLSSLQGLDTHQRVIYIGTFSKVLMPGLRLAYAVLPPDLVGAFVLLRGLIDRYTALPPQAALAEFINSGQFARHIRRTRKIYSEKRDVIVSEIRKHFGDSIEIDGQDSGMHIVMWLPEGISDRQMQRAAGQHNVSVEVVSGYTIGETQRHGILLGYTAVPIDKIPVGIEWLARAFDDVST